jgi:hypothetical protein
MASFSLINLMRRIKSPTLCVFLALYGTVLLGQTTNSATSPMAPDSANTQTKNGFAAQLWITERFDTLRDWGKTEHAVLDATTKVKRNVPVTTAIIFTNPGLDASGLANVTCDIKVLKPDGSIYADGKNLPGLIGKPAPGSDRMELADAQMKLRIEPKDPPGTYTVHVVVHDNIKKIRLSLKKSFEVAR